VKCGPLMGIQGILVRKKNLCRLVLSVEMLGEAAAAEVDAFLVERLNAMTAVATRRSPQMCGPESPYFRN
jgi:hypothetical protein